MSASFNPRTVNSNYCKTALLFSKNIALEINAPFWNGGWDTIRRTYLLHSAPVQRIDFVEIRSAKGKALPLYRQMWHTVEHLVWTFFFPVQDIYLIQRLFDYFLVCFFVISLHTVLFECNFPMVGVMFSGQVMQGLPIFFLCTSCWSLRFIYNTLRFCSRYVCSISHM